ncbi:MAG: hypothetical protein IPG87_12855 [Saprospiraceae bacterium]|nr:hypothetical protein [Candidatus Vicinibacter affinis]
MLSRCPSLDKILTYSAFVVHLFFQSTLLIAQNPSLPKACPVKNGHQITSGSISLDLKSLNQTFSLASKI